MSLLKVLVAAAAFSGAAGAGHSRFSKHTELSNYSFEDYLRESGKKYIDEGEFNRRRDIFNQNLIKIRSHNSKNQGWKMGVNKFTDMTADELKTFFGGDKYSLRANTKSPKSRLGDFKHKELPASVDWRDVPNVVSAVKDQGHCGSCWAFAASETIESHVAINTGILNEVSMQELVSCMSNDHSCGGTGGCSGATAELAFDYLAQHGLAELWSYGYLPEVYMSSYTGTNGACIRDEAYVKGGVVQSAAPRFFSGTGYELLPRNDYDELMNAIANIGPMAINIDASEWHSYESGVFSGCAQNDVDINHVVQLVGYGTDADSGKDYWLVRNSWSAEWGELGYIKLERSPGYCGMDYHNGDGVGCDYDPVNVTVCGMCGILYDSSYPTGAGLV